MCNPYNGNYISQSTGTTRNCFLGTFLIMLFGGGCDCNSQRICRDCCGNIHVNNQNTCNVTRLYATVQPVTKWTNSNFGYYGNNTMTENTINRNTACGNMQVRPYDYYGYNA